MKATAKCPKCGEFLETDCRGCIEGGTCLHTCKGEAEHDIIEVEWKLVPENEKELMEVEFDERS